MSTFFAMIVLVSGYTQAYNVPESPDAAVQPLQVAQVSETGKPDHTPVFHIQNRTEEPLLQADKPWEEVCTAAVRHHAALYEYLYEL